ncbi:MAG: O-antigen ligase family protein [candidate division WWE3 bacterium]|nr:O-antigen ligase family protein [candidate division WWE3 bacterium]
MKIYSKILRILLFLVVFTVPLGQLGKLPFVDPTIGLYFSDLFLGLFIIVTAFFLLVVDRRLKINLPIILAFIFAGWALVTLLLGGQGLPVPQLLVSFFYWVRLVAIFLFFWIIYTLKQTHPEVIKNLEWWLIGSGVLLAAAGFVQLIAFPDFGKLHPALGWDPHYYRLNSTFFDPNFTGGYLVLCVSLLLRVVNKFREEKNKQQITKNAQLRFAINFRGGNCNKSIAVCYLLFVILLIAIFLTFSRSAWLMLAILVFIYGAFKVRWLLFVALVIIFGAYFAVPRVQTRLAGITDPADSASFRLQSWQQGLQLSSKNLITGVGFNTLRYAKDASEFYDYREAAGVHSGAGFDSSILVVLATTGIPGLLLFLGFLGSCLIGMISRIGKIGTIGAESFLVNLSVIGALLALLIESNFVNSLFYAPIMVLEFAILGLCVD